MTLPPWAQTPSTVNCLEPVGRVVGVEETAFQEILVIANPENGTEAFFTAEKLSFAVAVLPSWAVAVHTQSVVQTIVSSYLPVTVPLVPSQSADRSSWAPFQAQTQRYQTFAAPVAFHETEYASPTLPLDGVLVTEIEGAASAVAGMRTKSADAAAFKAVCIFCENGLTCQSFVHFERFARFWTAFSTIAAQSVRRIAPTFFILLGINGRNPYIATKAHDASILKMNLLQVFFAISGVIIFVIALDISKRQKFNALHFLVFL